MIAQLVLETAYGMYCHILFAVLTVMWLLRLGRRFGIL